MGWWDTDKHTVTHWVSLWDVIDPFLLLTGGNLHNWPMKSENSQESLLPLDDETVFTHHCYSTATHWMPTQYPET